VNIVFATCEHQPLLTADDQVLADALTRLGISVVPIPWTEIDPYGVVDPSPILLRSTWDYHRVPTMFTVWLQSLQDARRMVWNDPAIALANIDKIYLQGLQKHGIAMPDTRWLDRPDAASIRQTMADAGWSKAVLKPRIAATAYGTYLLSPDVELTEDDLAPARASGAVLQEFIPEIADTGEHSLVYFEGAFSHAVVKRAKAGDFRVQKDFGGSVQPSNPGQQMRTFADAVINIAASEALYARVDLVVTARGPRLMELELIEPELYFVIRPDAAERFASSIAGKLTS
jgi:hypothetical protein